jgi:predicted AAA+ superfamily ATPase
MYYVMLCDDMPGKSKFFRRDLEDKILPFLDRDEIIIVRGPRQSGKTTLMKIIANRIKYKKEFVDFDIPSNRLAVSESPVEYVRRLAGNGGLSLFFDEIQRLENAGELMKIVYDTFKGRVKIFATGSSSLELKQMVLGALVGRAVVFELYTFGFGEFVRAIDEGLYKIFKERNDSVFRFIEKGTEPLHKALSNDLLMLWKEYIVYGGYPEVVKAKGSVLKESLLDNLANLYLEKDIVSFFRIEDAKEFENFVKVLSFNDSQILKLSNIANDAGISFYKAKQYLAILENTYIVKTVYPYFKNVATSIRKAPKLYFLDLGLRNIMLKNMLEYGKRDDIGKLAENFVFTELERAGKSIRYWHTKSGAEVDFVLEEQGGIVPVEVKMGGSKALGRSFYSFIRTYKPEKALVITLDELSKKVVNGTTVYSIPIFYL